MSLADQIKQLVKSRVDEIGLAERRSQSEATIAQVQNEGEGIMALEDGAAYMKGVEGIVYLLEPDNYGVLRSFNYRTKKGRWSLSGDSDCYYQKAFAHPFTEAQLLDDLKECLERCEALTFKD